MHAERRNTLQLKQLGLVHFFECFWNLLYSPRLHLMKNTVKLVICQILLQFKITIFYLNIVMNPVPALPFAHHIDFHTTVTTPSLWTTVPIRHGTDYTHTAVTNETRFISLWLPCSDRRVLFSLYLCDSYFTELVLVFILRRCVPNGIHRPPKGTSEWKQSWPPWWSVVPNQSAQN